MIVRVPPEAEVECWAVGPDGRRLGSSASGDLEVPDGTVLEVRGRRRRRVRLAWLADAGARVISVDVRRSEVAEDDLLAVAMLPDVAVLTAAGDGVTPRAVRAIAAVPRLAVLQLGAPALGQGELDPLRAATALRQVRLDVPGVPEREAVDTFAARALGAFGLAQPRLPAETVRRIIALWPLRELGVATQRLDGEMLETVVRSDGLIRLAIDATTVDLAAHDVDDLVRGLPKLRTLDLTRDGVQLDPSLMLGAWRQRPGLRVNGLTMGADATARFVTRWLSGTD